MVIQCKYLVIPRISCETNVAFAEQACVVAAIGVHQKQIGVHNLYTELTNADIFLK